MFIEQIIYKHGTEVHEDMTIRIPTISRDKYMTNELQKLVKEDVATIDNKGSTAFLYAAGPSIHNSDVKHNDHNVVKDNIVYKGQLGTKVFRLAGKFNNIDYVSINSDTCASSLKAVYDAQRLIEEYDDVIIYSENLSVEMELMFFKQLGIELYCGDGIAIVHLTKEKTTNSVAEVVDSAWSWNKETSPMTVSKDGYKKVIDKINTDGINIIKPHGTGTTGNDVAEGELLTELFPDVRVLDYKSEVGHTQGASTGIELGMLVDREKDFDALVLASGLGGFYGALRVKSI